MGSPSIESLVLKKRDGEKERERERAAEMLRKRRLSRTLLKRAGFEKNEAAVNVYVEANVPNAMNVYQEQLVQTKGCRKSFTRC